MDNQKPYQGWWIIADCDGVLTDGKKYVDATGKRQMIAFNSKDDRAAKGLIELGFDILIVTNSDFEGIANYWEPKGVFVLQCDGDKLEAIHEFVDSAILPLEWNRVIAIGDDLPDWPYLIRVLQSENIGETFGRAWVPDQKFDNSPFEVLDTPGGEGVLAEIYDMVCQHAKIKQYAS